MLYQVACANLRTLDYLKFVTLLILIVLVLKFPCSEKVIANSLFERRNFKK